MEDLNEKGVGETEVSPCRKILKTERLLGSEATFNFLSRVPAVTFSELTAPAFTNTSAGRSLATLPASPAGAGHKLRKD